eukprot:550941_1
MYRCPIKDPTCITWRFPRQNEPTYHTNCPTECRSNEFETCGADKASALLIAHSLFVAIQRGDYIIPAFDYVSNNTLSIVFHLLISKQKLGQPNKRDKVIMAKLWFEKRKEICCVVT